MLTLCKFMLYASQYIKQFKNQFFHNVNQPTIYLYFYHKAFETLCIFRMAVSASTLCVYACNIKLMILFILTNKIPIYLTILTFAFVLYIVIVPTVLYVQCTYM